MRSACLPPLHCASFAALTASPLQVARIAQPMGTAAESLRNRMAPNELARFVNDFLAAAACEWIGGGDAAA